MAKYRVPFAGYLLVEATSWQQAEIMSLMWRQSLLRVRTGDNPIRNKMNLTSSKDGIVESSSPEVQAVDLAFSASPFADITEEIEARREKVIEDDRLKWQKRGLPGSDWTEEQTILIAMSHEG